MNRIFTVLAFLLITTSVVSTATRIQPALQWTFEEAPEDLGFRRIEGVFPLSWVAYSDRIEFYDGNGALTRNIAREPGDSLISSAQEKFVALELMGLDLASDAPQRIVSIRVFNAAGEASFVHVFEMPLNRPAPAVTLSDNGRLIVAQAQSGLLQEVSSEGILYSERLADELPPEIWITARRGLRVGGTGHRLSSATLYQPGRSDSLFSFLRYSGADSTSNDKGFVGEIRAMVTIPASPYTFVDILAEGTGSVMLLNELEVLETYDWTSWDIHPLDSRTAFVITGRELLVLNLGDGSVAARSRTYDLFDISDASYLTEPEIFLVLRSEAFFREDGTPAYRNFELNGIDKSGRIVHRSSFGAWSPTLPEIHTLSGNRFAIHLHNAILVYDVSDN